jgi:DNA-binding transcriptional LysR family regulator
MHTQLPMLLSSFAENYPNVTLHFEEQPNNNLIHGLNNATLDIAFVRTWLKPENLEEKLLFNEAFVAVLPEKHPLSSKKEIAIKDLASENFIIFTRECGPTIFDQFLVLCTDAGFTPNILHQASQLNSILRLVESGFGISLLPKNTELGYNLKLKFIPLENVKETIPLIMLSRKENTNLALLHLQNHLLK